MVNLVFIQSLLSPKFPRISAVFNSDFRRTFLCLAIKPLGGVSLMTDWSMHTFREKGEGRIKEKTMRPNPC